MPGTETVVTTVNTDTKGALRPSSRVLALIAPEKTGASVGPNIVRKYSQSAKVATDHDGTSDESNLTDGTDAAIRSGARRVFAVSAEETVEADVAVGTTGTSFQVPSAKLPLTSVQDIKVDGGSPVTILYTTKSGADLTALTPSAGEAYINMSTGEGKTGDTASTSITASITFHDWDTALAALDAEAYECVAPAGFTVTEQNWGVWKKILTHAQTEDKLVVGAYESGIEPTDIDSTVDDVEDITAAMLDTDGRVILLGAYYTGDLTSAAAAQVVSTEPTATRKEQLAPAGVTYTDTYLRTDFGDQASPASTTFHGIGANAIFRDAFGVYRWSNFRTTAAVSSTYATGEIYRERRSVKEDIQQSILNARRATDDGLGVDRAGLAGVESVIRASLQRSIVAGYINPDIPVQVVMPDFDEISDSDRQQGIVDDAAVYLALRKQIVLVRLDINISL